MKTIQKPSISTLSPEALGYKFIAASSAAVFPAANDALFVPVVLQRPVLVGRMFSANGNVASGNLDLGIYTLAGRRIVSKGSTAQAGITTLQFLDINETYLGPGWYYMAVAMDNGVGTLRRFNISIIRQQHFGVMKAVSAFPLPLSVTLITPTATYIPHIGMELVGLL